jgi:hypothetical protein
VIREEKHLISHAPYAVDLDSLSVETRFVQKRILGEWVDDPERPLFKCTIRAAWFRRKSGVLSAHLGTLWDTQTTGPANGSAYLRAFTDGRYGGNCFARWDADNLWAPESSWEQMKEYEEFLRPMLERFPEVPPGFDGWWSFKGNA